MARLFDDASTQYLEVSSAIVTSWPVTLAAWVMVDDDTHGGVIIGIGDIDVDNDWLALQAGDTTPAIYATLYNGNGGGYAEAQTTANYTQDVWCHAAAVFTSDTSRAAYINGANKGTNATDVSFPDNADTTRIGRHVRASGAGEMSGAIKGPAAWNVALTDDEIAALAAGADPRTIRPESLVAYWPLVRTDQDIVGGYDMTATNNPTWTDGPGTEVGPARVHVGAPSAGETLSIAVVPTDSAYEVAAPAIVG